MIYSRFIFELAGSPKNFVEDFAKKLLAELRGLDYINIKKENIAEPSEQKINLGNKEINLWTTFVEIEAEFEDLESFFNFIVDYSPSSIEVIEPEKIEISNFDLNRFLNDITHRMISLMMQIQNLRAENELLKRRGRRT